MYKKKGEESNGSGARGFPAADTEMTTHLKVGVGQFGFLASIFSESVVEKDKYTKSRGGVDGASSPLG